VSVLDEGKQNRKLLYTHLKKLYNPTQATELMLKHKDHLFDYNGLAWSVGKRNFEFFCMYFLQDVFLVKEDNAAAPIALVHRQIWKDIQDSILGNGPDQIGRIEPRGTGKSAFGTFATTIWCHCYKFKKYTLLCSDIGSTAEKFTKDIKNTFLENKYIDKAFGKLLDDKDKRYICNSTQLEFTNGTFIESISSASPMRGRKYDNCRPDLIILDDYQSEDDCRTEEARLKKWTRFSNDVKYASQKAVYREGKVIKKGTTFIALGTLQHKECFYSRLIKQPTWKFKNDKGVLIDDFVEDGKLINGLDRYFETGLWKRFKTILFNFKIETHLEDAKEFYWSHQEEMKFPLLWAEFWDCLDMAMSYYENPSSFKQEVQGDVNSIGEKWFKTINTEKRIIMETHKFIKTMLCVDPASTANGKSDYSAYLVGSESDTGLKYARKSELAKINARTDFDKYVKHMADLLKEYPDATHIYIEKNTFNGADANTLEKLIDKDPLLKYRNIEIINESTRKNKDDRISTIIPYMNKGQIIFAEEDVEFIDQMKEFAGQKFSTHDDAPDVTAEFANRISDIEVIKPIKFYKREVLGV
jgi:predicted phage terminase large subunit-like protein